MPIALLPLLAGGGLKGLGRKGLRKLRKVGRIFGRKKRRRRRRAAREAARIAKTQLALNAIDATSGDIDNTGFFKSKRRKEEEKADKQRNFILMVAGIGLAAVVFLILIFKK